MVGPFLQMGVLVEDLIAELKVENVANMSVAITLLLRIVQLV